MDPDAYDIHVFHPEAPLPPFDDEGDEEEWEDMPNFQGCSEIEISENTACHTFCSHSGESVNGGCEAQCEGTCTICLESFKDGDAVRALPCLHTFHADCVDKWLAGHRLCPICKQDITGQQTQREPTGLACSEGAEAELVTRCLDFAPRQVHEVQERPSPTLSLGSLRALGPLSRLTRSAATVFHGQQDLTQASRSGRSRRLRRSPCIIAL